MSSAIKVSWRDGQQVDVDDLLDEQTHHDTNRESLELDFHGEGVLLGQRLQTVLYNSVVEPVSMDDGRPIVLETDTSDTVNGELLEINVSFGELDGYASARLILVGTDRDNNDFIELMEFGANDVRLTRNYYKRLRSVIPAGFTTSGARLLIREASSLQLDKDFIMVEQAESPNVFIRDFPSFNPLFFTIEDVIATTTEDFDLLNIDTGGLEQIQLIEEDTATILGQKFQAKTDNIQKVQLLLSVEKDETIPPPANPEDPNPQFDWTGDISVSIRALATTTQCPDDIQPQNAIDFDPELITLAQINVDRDDLESQGIRLTDTPTPVDFVFSTTPLSRAGEQALIVPGRHYAVTIQRQGATNTGKVIVDVGEKRSSDTLFTTFDGKDWTDNNAKDLWFKVFTDGAFVASGVAYDNGVRVEIPKTQLLSTGETVQFLAGQNSVATSAEGENNNISVEQREELINPEPDARTGNSVPTRIKDIAQISAFTDTQLNALTNQPVLLGQIQDINIRAGTNRKTQYASGDFSVGDTFFFTAIPAPFAGRNLKNHIFIPDARCSTLRFRIVDNDDSTIVVERLFNPDPTNPIDVSSVNSQFANPGLFGLDYEIRFFPAWEEEDLRVIDERTKLPRNFLEDQDGYSRLVRHIPSNVYVGGQIFPDGYGGVDGYGNVEGYGTLMQARYINVNYIPGLIAQDEDLQTTLEAIKTQVNIITGGGGGGGLLVDSPAIIPADGITGQDETIGTGVKTPHIQDDAITQDKMADSSVGTDELIDANVTNPKMAINSVNTANLVDLSVTNPKLAEDAVATINIQDGAVTPSKLSFTVGGGLPSGAMLFFFGSVCPVGTVREASLDGLFLRGAATGAATPIGSDTHDHGTHAHSGSTSTASAHTHSMPNHDLFDIDIFDSGFGFIFDAFFPGVNNLANTGSTGSAGGHSHSLSINPASVPSSSHVPSHAEILICTVV